MSVLDDYKDKIIKGLETKAENLDKIVKNLEAKQSNLEKDIKDLSDKKSDLDKKIVSLDEYLKNETKKAISEALIKIEKKDNDLKDKIDTLDKNHSKLVAATEIANQKSKDADKAKENAAISIRDYVFKIKEVENIREKLSNIIKYVKENL